MSDGTMTLFDGLNRGNPLEAIEKIGDWMATSGMFGCTKKEQGQVLAMACLCERKNPLDLLREFYIIDGRLSKRTDSMLADYLKHSGRVTWMDIGDSGKEARAVWEKDGNKIEIAFTFKEAHTAGLVRKGSTWEKNPGAMLRARLISKAIRILDPGVMTGVYSEEEIHDITPHGAPSEAKPLFTSYRTTQRVIDNTPAPAPATEDQPSKRDQALELIGEIGTPAIEWLEERGWMGAGKTLSDSNAAEIAARPDAFRAAVLAWDATRKTFATPEQPAAEVGEVANVDA